MLYRLASWLWRNRRSLTVFVAFGVLWRATNSPVAAGGILLAAAVVASLAWARQRRRAQAAEGMRVSPLWRVAYDVWKEEGRRAALAASWGRACRNVGLKADGGTTPGLYRLRRTPWGDFTGIISSRSGVPVSKVATKTGELAEILGLREVVVAPAPDGRATIEFRRTDRLARPVLPRDLKRAPAGCIPLGVRDDGSVEYERVLDDEGRTLVVPTLAGGVTGSGKSGYLHARLAGYLLAGIPVRLRILDPAGGSELAAYAEQVGKAEPGALFSVHRYSNNPADATRMVKEALADARERMELMAARRVRLHTPTPEEPLDLFVTDEHTGLPDALLKKGSDLHVLMAQGRKAGFSVVSLTQLSEKSNIGDLRELFRTRVCLGTVTHQQTTAILGDSGDVAHLAPAHRIPPSQPGVYYRVSEVDRAIVKARLAYYDDAAVDLIARGVVPSGLEHVAQERPCAVYELYSQGREGLVLEYVGKAVDPMARFEQHIAETRGDPHKAEWLGRVRQLMEYDPEGAFRVEWFPSEAKALEVEERRIKEKGPRQNKVHNRRNPLRVVRELRPAS